MKIAGYLMILFFSNVLGSLAGFGAGLLSMPFLTQLFEGKMIIIASSITCLLNAYIAIVWRKHILWKKLGEILLFMCIGLPLGVISLKVMPISAIKIILGILMVVIGIYGLLKMNNKKIAEIRFGKWPLRICLFAGGIAQGVVSGGGSFVIMYAQQEIRDKQQFRATLALVWTAVSIVAIAQYWIAGMLSQQSFFYAAIGAPAVFLGIWTGGVISRRVSQRTFMLIVNILLIVAGSISFISQIGH